MNQEWTHLVSFVPNAPGQAIRWEEIESSILSPYIMAMTRTEQQAEYHGEGDVWTHTRLVCERLIEPEFFWKLNRCRQTELFIAALLHDIGKIRTTRLEDGRWVSPHHSAAGMQIARQFLWTACDLAGTEEAQRIRETICLLIRCHMFPEHLLDREDPASALRRIAVNGQLAADFTLEMLCMLAEADVLGRIADDTQELRELVQLCVSEAEAAGCLTEPYRFPDSRTAYAYLSGRAVMPDYPVYDDTWGEVILLCGLPGTGKDTWIERNLPGMPMLSLDSIRGEMGVKPTDEQGCVIQEAQKRAKALLAAQTSFVFNATNVTEMTRGKWVRLFEQYHARVRIVFLETAWSENMRRNAARKAVVPEIVITGLLDKLTLPVGTEAQYVEWKTT